MLSAFYRYETRRSTGSILAAVPRTVSPARLTRFLLIVPPRGMTKKLQITTLEPTTIGQQIESLARLTGAPLSFVGQVRNLCSGKGSAVNTNASPCIAALEEAFTREETIGSSTVRARRSLSRF